MENEELKPQIPEVETVQDQPKADPPTEKAERLSPQQKLFFLLVLIFALFLVFLKLFWEKEIVKNAKNPPRRSVDFNMNDYSMPDYYPGMEDMNRFNPPYGGGGDDDSSDTYGPIPDGE